MLERLNSVLDPSRTLTVPEKGERQLETTLDQIFDARRVSQG